MSYYLLDHPNPNFPQFGAVRRNRGKVTGTIVLHDAENATDLDGADSGAEAVAHFIATRQSYGSYHMLVDRDSIIFMAPWDYEVWHCVPTNNWSIGISVAWRKSELALMGSAARAVYYRQLAEAVLIATDWLSKNRGITVPLDRFLTRAEAMARKPGITTHSRTDPGRRSDPFGTGSGYEAEFLAVLAQAAGQPAPAPQPPAPAPQPGLLAVDGWWGPATTRRAQQVLGTVADGVVSNQLPQFQRVNPGLDGGWDWTGRPYDEGSALIKAIQTRVGANRDGHAGPETFTKLQRHLGTVADGFVSGPSTMVKAMQAQLNAGQF